MSKRVSKSIPKFRSALGNFLKLKLDYRLNRGEFDHVIEKFLSGDFEGDTFTITQGVSLITNDVPFMNLLLGNSVAPGLKRRLYKLWDKENDARYSP